MTDLGSSVSFGPILNLRQSAFISPRRISGLRLDLLFYLCVHSRFRKVLALVFPLTLPVMDRQGVPVWIKDGGHSAPGEIQGFDNKLGAGGFEFLDRLIEIGDF